MAVRAVMLLLYIRALLTPAKIPAIKTPTSEFPLSSRKFNAQEAGLQGLGFCHHKNMGERQKDLGTPTFFKHAGNNCIRFMV